MCTDSVRSQSFCSLCVTHAVNRSAGASLARSRAIRRFCPSLSSSLASFFRRSLILSVRSFVRRATFRSCNRHRSIRSLHAYVTAYVRPTGARACARRCVGVWCVRAFAPFVSNERPRARPQPATNDRRTDGTTDERTDRHDPTDRPRDRPTDGRPYVFVRRMRGRSDGWRACVASVRDRWTGGEGLTCLDR